MGMTGINVALLRKTLEDITAHPEEWNQGGWATRLLKDANGSVLSTEKARETWSDGVGYVLGQKSVTECGTACCLAGNVAVKQLGGKPVYDNSTYFHTVTVMLDGVPRNIKEVAMEALVLTNDQAEMLFEANNELSELWEIAHDITDGEIEIPLQFQTGVTS